MRQSHDLSVFDTRAECDYYTDLHFQWVKKSRSQYYYADITCTLDIETTNTEDDGFLYTIQFNIDGQNALLRYVEDFIDVIDNIVEAYGICRDYRLVLYIHNLGYEHFYLTQILDKRWHVTDVLFTKPHKPLYIRYANGIELRDSLKLFQKSLAGATKGLPHEKMKGDLDYTKYRTPDTPLEQMEFDYCVNDVQGLYEAIEKLKRERGYNQATIPLTNTAMVVQEMNKYIRQDGKVMKCMKELALSQRQLTLAFKCMAGGDTHGCRWKAGRIFTNCNSHDEKSAHPSQQLLRTFPMGRSTDLEDVCEDDLATLIDIGHGWIAEVVIVNPCIRPDCPDPTISVSKCPEIEGKGDVDNGRLLSAEAIRTYMDSNDYIRFKDAYTYDHIQGVYVVEFPLAHLPRTFVEGVLDKFRIKESADDGPERVFAKICVNTIFGACAQKCIRDEHSLSIEETIEIETSKWEATIKEMDDAEVIRKQKNKFPFLWGLWTASLSRLSLWKLIKAVGWEKAIYWDTDSCKYEGKVPTAITEYNREVINLCEQREVVVQNRNGDNVYIGVAENEYPDVEYGYKEFVFLHAKCYAALGWDKKRKQYEIQSTIAGVGKAEGVKALAGDIRNLRDGLYIQDAGGNKLKYVDRPVFTRTDFDRPTECASFIYMTPRDYEVSFNIQDKIEIYDNEIIAE